MYNLVLYGGTGQAKVIHSILPNDVKVIAIIDDTPNLPSPIQDVPIFCGLDNFINFYKTLQEKCYFLVTIGNPYGKARQEISNALIELGLVSYSCISEKSVVYSTNIGNGIQIHPGSIIMTNVTIGDYCILNTLSLVEHDCILENGVEIGPSATVAGEVYIEENTWIGAGAVILDKLHIGKNVIVGAGAVVTKDIPDSVVVVGNPAKILKENK